MDGRGDCEKGPYGCRLEDGPLGVFLRWKPDLLEGMPSEERVTPLVLLAGPIEPGLEHPQVPLNRASTDAAMRHASAAPPNDIVVNPVRSQLAHRLGASEELGEITTSLSDVLEVALSLQGSIRKVSPLLGVP
jgi:hypothetical protein